MRRTDLAHRLDGDAHRRAEQHQRHLPRRATPPAVAERMVLVRLARRDGDAAPHDQRRGDVGERLHAVGDERIRVPSTPAAIFASASTAFVAAPAWAARMLRSV